MKTRLFPILFLTLLYVMSCSSDDDRLEMTEEMQEVIAPMDLTSIPDTVFENYLIDRGVDDIVDGWVVTENLLSITEIVVNDLDISDLTGIEDCPNLFNLWLQNCKVSSLDVSNNTKLQFLYFDDNTIANIDISNLPSLEKLSGRDNNLSEIAISNNEVLELLEISGNDIIRIDVSANTALFRLDISQNPVNCITVNENQLVDTNLQWTLDDDDTLRLDCN